MSKAEELIDRYLEVSTLEGLDNVVKPNDGETPIQYAKRIKSFNQNVKSVKVKGKEIWVQWGSNQKGRDEFMRALAKHPQIGSPPARSVSNRGSDWAILELKG